MKYDKSSLIPEKGKAAERKTRRINMDHKEMYQEWLNNPYFDEGTKAELQRIAEDEKEIEERFYMDLEFGTAGLRGVIV